MFPIYAMTMGGAAVAAPTLASVSTAGGAVGDIAGAYAATLTGTAFTGATGVTFGGVAATSVVVVNATTITCVVPARPTGASSVIVTTPGGSNGANSLFEYYSPAQEALTGWWRGSFSGAPWVPTASAGTSGANGNLAVGVAPSVGAALNGYAPLSLNGTTQYLQGGTCPTFYGGTSGSIFALIKPNATAVAASAGYDEPTSVGSTGASPSITYTTSGFGFLLNDGAYRIAYAAASAGNYHAVQVKWDGTNMRYRVDGGAWASLAVGTAALAGGNLEVGANYSLAAFFGGLIEEIVLSNTTISDAAMDKLKSYVNTRYALAI